MPDPFEPDQNLKPKTAKKQKPPKTKTLEDFFGKEGPLARALPGYEMRDEQLVASLSIEEAMKENSICLSEAGTGVGKSIAYLIPAVRAALDGKRTVISTHTINLQNQLIEKDIPLVLSLFPEGAEKVQAVLMKGRGNYLCKQNLEHGKNDLFLMSDPVFQKVRRWAGKMDCSGDIADLPFNFTSWHELTSTSETCRNQECLYYDNCHYYRMRKEAQEANLVVVNHALFFADLAMKVDEPNSGVLPNYDHVVFDEAHHLEDVATKTFGIEFGSRRLEMLMERIRHIKGLDIDKSQLEEIETLNLGLFAPFTQVGRQEFYFEEALAGEAQDATEQFAKEMTTAISALQNTLVDMSRDNEELKDQLEGMGRLCGKASEELHRLIFEQDDTSIKWGESVRFNRGGKQESRVQLHLTPISVAKILETNLWNRQKKGGMILISATLSNSGGFSYQRQRLGVPLEANECLVGSPFDYKSQALLYVPAHFPSPPSPPNTVYTDLVVTEIEKVVRMTEGRAFLLFTSRAMMNSVYEKLHERLLFPIFKQGDLPPAKLIEAFKQSGNGCLMGVQTFWEGVDVQGEALSCVIIDKLPFAVPDSPITKARIKAIENEGGSSFRDFSIPQAQIRLKQGFGRLIRTNADRGIVCILDSRMLTKDYGAEFVKYLPPASRASKWNRVEKFWKDAVAKETIVVEATKEAQKIVSDPIQE